MKKINYYLWMFFGFLFISLPVVAEAKSFGDIASNLFGAEMGIKQIVHVICMVTGIALIFASVLQYKKHRQNPSEVPLTTPIMSLLVGLALIAMTFIPLQI